MNNLGFVRVVCLPVSFALPVLAQIGNPQPTEFSARNAATVSSPVCAPDCGTQALANNDLGEIVGYYTDANVVFHGFLRSPDGEIGSFDAPGAGTGAGQGTAAYAINDLGVIAGFFQDSSNVSHGFVRYPDGSFTKVDAPGAGTAANQGTLAWNVNLLGTTAGIYIDSSNVYHGFIRTPNNEFTSVDPAGSVYTYLCEETCLTLDGTVVGFFL